MAEGMTYTSAAIDNQFSDALARNLIRSGVVDMPANNLLSADAGISMIKGYFLMIAPLRPGTHTIASWVEFGTDFAGGLTYTINVH